MGKKHRYYVVWVGRETGIFDSWERCSAQVSGFKGAKYKGFETLAEAHEAFRGTYEEYIHRSAAPRNRLSTPGTQTPILDSYCVDAACSGSCGPVEYRGVKTATREVVFARGPYECGTANIGEFLAIVHALAVCKKQNISVAIYSDSKNGILWVQKKKCNTRLARDHRNVQLFDLIARAEKWLEINDYPNPVLKWDTNAWGEIPADYGRK